MAINKNRVMEAAQKFVEKGQLDKAIKEYSKIVEEDAKDVRVWLKLGDLHARKGSKLEATDTYLRVAQYYGDQGFYLKAVAVYKQVLKLDPRLIDVNVRLAEVYRQLGLLSDAMQQYELVAAFYHREGRSREALATIRELVELDPDNVATRIKLAELYSKEQMVPEAVAEFGRAADYLRTHGRMDDFIKVAERLVWHQPDNHALNRELAGLYLKRNDPRHALQKLQACFKADARDVDTLALLASAFLALDQKQKTVSVWKELARVYAENQQGPQSVEVQRRILSLVPDDADALAAVGGRQAVGTGSTRAIAGNAAPAAPAPAGRVVTPIGSEPGERGPVPRVAVPAGGAGAPRGGTMPPLEAAPLVTMKGRRSAEVADAGVASTPTGPAVPMGPVAARPAGVATPIGRAPVPVRDDDAVAIEVDEEVDRTTRSPEPTVEATLDAALEPMRSRALEGEGDEAIAKLLGETDVYIKYGIRERAITHLGKVLALDADNLDARERLKDVYLSLGRKGEAAAELAKLVELTAAVDAAQAAGYLAELRPLDANTAAALEGRHGLRVAGSEGGAGGAGHDGEFDSLDSVDVVIEGPSVSAPPRGLAAARAVAGTAAGGPELDDGTEVRTAVGGAPEGTMEVDPADISIVVGDDPALGDDAAPDVGFDAGGATAGGADLTTDVATETGVPAPVEAPGSARSASGTLEDDLDEADFFVTQGLVDEARAILVELLRRHPGHPLIEAKLRDIAAIEAAPATLRPGSREAEGAAADGTTIASVSQSVPVPEGPRRVIARPLGEADADTHYDLGLAYKEMGLLEEAIKEFERVRDTPGRTVQCHLMIGLCHIERGKLPDAVEEFKGGLYVDGITERESLALYYELGAAYEALGDEREAVYYYDKVAKRDPRFRDVARRLDHLHGRAALAPGNGARERREPGRVGNDSTDEEMRSALDSLLGEGEA
jgi:tetratricopeptide (TPR) repeat protein